MIKVTTMPKTVLIVEDNELNMKLLNDLLQSKGYGTLLAADGVKGLELARQHKPDLIIMDIQLPGISGLEVTRTLKADDELKAIPVVAVTAFARQGDKEAILEAGCDAYIAKPISIVDFMETVARHLS